MAVAAATACSDAASPFDVAPVVSGPLTRPQTVVLLATPKFIADFAAPDSDVRRFLKQYAPLTSHAANTIVIFAVGNSDHILYYKGRSAWDEQPDWARFTDWQPITNRTLSYAQIAGIVRAFKTEAASSNLSLRVFDQIDSGNEFTTNIFKILTHPECFPSDFHSWDIRATLKADAGVFATAPQGIAAGTSCGQFLIDQTAQYVHDLGFDGILYGNQLGTRGRWLPGNGPGYSADEANAIRQFMARSKAALGDRQLMWFDSYNNTKLEHDTWSVPADTYQYFDYLIAAGFCVITNTDRYVDDLQSKLRIGGPTRIIATLDYVDPWYSYESMVNYADESRRLENVAIAYRDAIDGIVFFANDATGRLVPESIIDSFARRFFDGNEQ